MFDRLLEVGCVFDWISPLLAMVQDIRHGPNNTFYIPEDGGWSGRSIAKLLQKNGVKTWGHMTVNCYIMLTCEKRQAAWASSVLQREGVPVEYGLVESKGERHSNERPTKKRRGVTGLLASIVDDFRL